MNELPGTFLITGASGGIGGAIALAMARPGTRLVLLGRNLAGLAEVAQRAEMQGALVRRLVADLANTDMELLARQAIACFGALDGVINCAGVQTFGLSSDENAQDTARLFATNVVAPIQLINALLPHLQTRPHAQVVNIGSIFGSIGFPCFASYSASKYALRGYSEALRRELADTTVRVHYVAPRYTRTALNREPVARMADALGMHQDSPEDVARQVVAALVRGAADTYLGWPEKLFVRLNALLPRLVDHALIRQARRMRPFVKPTPARGDAAPINP